jgi:hypothetical protein
LAPAAAASGQSRSAVAAFAILVPGRRGSERDLIGPHKRARALTRQTREIIGGD